MKQCEHGLTTPWLANHYPSAMKHLPALAREKFIEIANALLREGYEEGIAIRIAIAKERPLRHGWGPDAPA